MKKEDQTELCSDRGFLPEEIDFENIRPEFYQIASDTGDISKQEYFLHRVFAPPSMAKYRTQQVFQKIWGREFKRPVDEIEADDWETRNLKKLGFTRMAMEYEAKRRVGKGTRITSTIRGLREWTFEETLLDILVRLGSFERKVLAFHLVDLDLEDIGPRLDEYLGPVIREIWNNDITTWGDFQTYFKVSNRRCSSARDRLKIVFSEIGFVQR